jgi:hypothetical protein
MSYARSVPIVRISSWVGPPGEVASVTKMLTDAGVDIARLESNPQPDTLWIETRGGVNVDELSHALAQHGWAASIEP